MKDYKITTAEGLEVTVQVHDDDDAPVNAVPVDAEPKARKPANKAKAASNK